MESTEIPSICCMLQRLGSDFGQDGSTRYCGAPLASTACPGTTCAYPIDAAAYAPARHKPTVRAARVLIIEVSSCSWPLPMTTSQREVSTLLKSCREGP